MTAIDRCPNCDQPRGDQARADNLPIVRQWASWVAERPGEQRPIKWREVADAQRADQPGLCIEGWCPAVDWRARALAAESRSVEQPSAILRPTWTALSDHELTATLGPIEVEVRRWGVDTERDEWGFYAQVSSRAGGIRIASGHHRGRGAPLEVCKRDAIAAVVAWRDSIVPAPEAVTEQAQATPSPERRTRSRRRMPQVFQAAGDLPPTRRGRDRRA